MEHYETIITELSELAGIVPEYYDIFGKKHVISMQSRIAILSAMDLAVGTVQEVTTEIQRIKTRQWRTVLDPVTVISVHGQPHGLAMHLALADGKEQAAETLLTLEDEQGKREILHFPANALQVEEQRIIEDRRFVRIRVPLPQLKIGYYRVTLACSHPKPVFDNNSRYLETTARLIVTPDTCYMPEQLQCGKTWGVAANLYSLRSERNCGIGDFGDLRRLVVWLSGLNAGLVGINPLHAIPNTAPFGTSPYSPISRLYRNFIYIDLEGVAELSGIPLSARMANTIESLRKSERIDYQGVAAVKQERLEQAYELFYLDHYLKESARGRAFREYLRIEGEPLMDFALFLALSEFMTNEHKGAIWQEWPDGYHSPVSAQVKTFRNNNEKRVIFFAYLQWLIDSQMAEVSAAASSAGMFGGLYGDLAIGAVDSGSDGWGYQDVLAELVTVGAPPDDFNAHGQDWGFPPMIPDKLRESGYDLFIRTIRKNMQHMGALRIDHALGLFRLFWIPKGTQPGDGAYVRCNAEELIRIIALESVRNKTLVIGEDLGTITDEARQALHRFGILSYRLFYFERNYPDPSFLSPEQYPSMALTAITTHDLPTLNGYWIGRDLDVKRQLGLIRDDSAYHQQKNDRERDRKLVLAALEMRGLFGSCLSKDTSSMPAMTPELCCAVYRYLSISPAKLVLVSLDDVIGTNDQQNMPGTVAEYPNWMQKTPISLEEIIADPRWQSLADMFSNTRAMNRS